MFCLFIGGSSSLGKLPKSARDQNYHDESLSTNSKEDGNMLNVLKAGLEYKQVEDTAVPSDFRLEEMTTGQRCTVERKMQYGKFVTKCSNNCKCKWACQCVPRV